jgi:hypothetical protein
MSLMAITASSAVTIVDTGNASVPYRDSQVVKIAVVTVSLSVPQS